MIKGTFKQVIKSFKKLDKLKPVDCRFWTTGSIQYDDCTILRTSQIFTKKSLTWVTVGHWKITNIFYQDWFRQFRLEGG